MSEVKTADIRISEGLTLRGCDQNHPDFVALQQSIDQYGIQQSISVCERVDKQTGETFYQLVDGMQRFTAASNLGLETVPVNVVQADTDEDVLVRQVIGNLHRVDTKPAQFTRAMLQLLNERPGMTIPDLAKMVNYSEAWVNSRLNLRKLEQGLQDLTDAGKITASNAVLLSQLPIAQQLELADEAQTTPTAEFASRIKAVKNEMTKQLKKGEDLGQYDPQPYLRKAKEIKEELETGLTGRALCEKFNLDSPVDGFALAIQWCMSFDPDAKQEQLDKHNQKEEERNLKRQKAKEERSRARLQRSKLTQERTQLIHNMTINGASDAEINTAIDNFNKEHGLVKDSK